MTKPQKIEGGVEERFDKWRNDGEHESLSDKNGIISHWEVKMILEFIHQELILKGVTDFGIMREEIEKAVASERQRCVYNCDREDKLYTLVHKGRSQKECEDGDCHWDEIKATVKEFLLEQKHLTEKEMTKRFEGMIQVASNTLGTNGDGYRSRAITDVCSDLLDKLKEN